MQTEKAIASLIVRLNVDAAAGRAYWRVASRTHPNLVGKEAGYLKIYEGNNSRWVIRGIKRAQVIFFYVHGYLPEVVDHRNRKPLDDRIDNLRAANGLTNAWNHTPHAKKASLPSGVKLLPSGRFQARIAFDGLNLALGSFPTPEEASAIYQAKRKELFGEFA